MADLNISEQAVYSCPYKFDLLIDGSLWLPVNISSCVCVQFNTG